MQTDADIIHQLQVVAIRRRAPLWLAVLLPWLVLLSLPGVLAALAFAVWDYRRLQQRVARDWTLWLDGTVPSLEDSSSLLVKADGAIARLQRQRILGRVASLLTPDVLSSIASERVRRFDARWFLASLLLAGAWFGWQFVQTGPAPSASDALARLAVDTSEIVVKIDPPRYTGVARFNSAPRDLQVPQNSAVEWCLRTPQPVDTPIELSDGQMLKIGRECARWSATESVFWRWRGKRYNLRVLPDLAPTVTFVTPRDMLQVLPAAATHAGIAVQVRDDYQIKRATLHLTLARGSGENIRFSDREVPLPGAGDPRARDWSRNWTLGELGMEPGDELYFFVRAADNAEPPHITTSPTYTLRLPGPVSAEEESTALPMLVKPENLRSQRQIIIDTEQLVADMKANPRLGYDAIRARSEKIAGDQAMLRRRYGKFMGEESSLFGEEDHDEPAGGGNTSIAAQYGHAHDEAENATLFDEATKKILRRALAAMWDAERELRAISPKPALPPEYKALAAIKELQQADRIYLHKTSFVPPALKEELRMTGDVVGTKSYRRAQGDAADPVPAQVRDLLAALGAEGPLPALWTRDAQDWIRARITNDDQRLEAQRAVQDVADGCAACRHVLRAWLRGGIANAPVILQARPVADTPFTQAWKKGSAP